MNDLEQLRFSVPNEVAEAVTNLLQEQGHGVEQRDGETLNKSTDGNTELLVWLPDEQVEERVAQVRALLASLKELELPVEPFDWSSEPVAAEQWQEAYKEFFPVLRLGQFVVIKPSWREYEPESHDQVVEIDPGMAFGTGLHASTALAVEIMERLTRFDRPPTRVVDVGAGTGILSLVAARFWPGARILAVENDPVAAEICKENVARNELEQRIEVLHQSIAEFHEPPPKPPGGPRGAGEQTQPMVPRPSSLVLANLTREILLNHHERVAGLLRDTGALVLSGLLDEEASEVAQLYCEELKLETEFTTSRDGWRALLLRTPPH